MTRLEKEWQKASKNLPKSIQQSPEQLEQSRRLFMCGWAAFLAVLHEISELPTNISEHEIEKLNTETKQELNAETERLLKANAWRN